LKNFVTDASVILKAYFPDEEGHAQAQTLVRDWITGAIQIIAPPLLLAEVTNGILIAVRKGRISKGIAYEILQQIEDLSIPLQEPPSIREIFKIATNYDRTAYDATYLSLAMGPSTFILLTGDKKLYHALEGRMKRIMWIEDYKGHQQP